MIDQYIYAGRLGGRGYVFSLLGGWDSWKIIALNSYKNLHEKSCFIPKNIVF
jgi:hypothetical protein